MKELVKTAAFGALCLIMAACSAAKPKASVKQYPLTGRIVSVDLKEHTAKIDAAAIPDYMGAMTMDYPIEADADLTALKPGENISATVNVSSDDSYSLSNIRERAGK